MGLTWSRIDTAYLEFTDSSPDEDYPGDSNSTGDVASSSDSDSEWDEEDEDDDN